MFVIPFHLEKNESKEKKRETKSRKRKSINDLSLSNWFFFRFFLLITHELCVDSRNIFATASQRSACILPLAK